MRRVRATEFYITTLVRIGEMRLSEVSLSSVIGEVQYFSDWNVYSRVFLAILRYGEKLTRTYDGGVKRKSDVGAMLFSILKRENSVMMLCKFIALDREKHEKPQSGIGEAWFSDSEYDEMKKLYCERIAALQLADGIVTHASFFDLFRCWVMLLREIDDEMLYREFSETNNKYITDYGALSKMLVFFAKDERAARDDLLAYAIDVDRMERFWTQEQIATIKATLECQTLLQEQDRLFLKCLEFVEDMKKRVGNIDAASQMEYLKSNNAVSKK